MVYPSAIQPAADVACLARGQTRTATAFSLYVCVTDRSTDLEENSPLAVHFVCDKLRARRLKPGMNYLVHGTVHFA